MRKIALFSLVLPAFLLVLSGCSQKTNEESQNNAETPSTPNTREMRRPDFGQPDRQTDIRGIIKSIVGNEVTVLKIDNPARGINQENASSTTETNTKEEAANKNVVSLTGASGVSGGRPAGGMMGGGPDGPGGPTGQNTTTRTAMLEKIKEMSTGEEKIIIPVGIKMLKAGDSSQSGAKEMIEATLSDLTADKMITIWLNQSISDKKVAEFVLIN